MKKPDNTISDIIEAAKTVSAIETKMRIIEEIRQFSKTARLQEDKDTILDVCMFLLNLKEE